MSSLDKVSKFDFHIHSKYSFDSFMDIEKIIKVAKKRGIDGIAIADHNTIKGGRKVLKIGKYIPLIWKIQVFSCLVLMEMVAKVSYFLT